MTVGEKIQSQRKHLNMSQEELGQKLCVSRQTISLWEKDQTLPTVDKLIQLKQIFGLSVDELLSENGQTAEKETPNETYQFTYTENDIREVSRLSSKLALKTPSTFAILSFLVGLIVCVSYAPGYIIGIFGAILAIQIIVIIAKQIINNKKTAGKTKEILLSSVYRYEIYDGYLKITIWRNDEIRAMSKCDFSDIQKVQFVKDYMLLQIENRIFVIRKSELSDDSFFYSHIGKNPAKLTAAPIPERWRILSILLVAATFMSLPCAMMCVGALTAKNGLFPENMWLLFLWTPVPIASVIFGFMAKNKGCKYKKNIITGIIFAVLLCLYGSFAFTF